MRPQVHYHNDRQADPNRHHLKDRPADDNVDFLGDLALRTWVNLNPSPQWANRAIEQYRGLPFGTWLHKSRPRRQRTLTGNIFSADDSVISSVCRRIGVYADESQRTDEQVQSRFLQRLPLDLRLIIYELVIGGKLIQLSAYDSRSPMRYRCSDLSLADSSFNQYEDISSAAGLLSLLLTCRQIYSEAIDVLYSANVYEFTQNFVAFAFLTQMVPAHRLKSIRHLKIQMRIPRHPALNSRTIRDWADLWSFFGTGTSGLQSLALELQMLPPTEDHIRNTIDSEAQVWIQPILDMAARAETERRCDVSLKIRHTVHRPASIYREVLRNFPKARSDEVARIASTRLHKAIRLCLDASEEDGSSSVVVELT